MIDNFYYFDKSTKRKCGLAGYYQFCDLEYRKIIKHISTRWLSLESAVHRTLLQYAGLRAFFLSEGIVYNIEVCSPNDDYIIIYLYFVIVEDSSARFNRLVAAYKSPINEVYLLFYQSVLQLFKNTNMFLQREDPIIPVLNDQLIKFVKNLLGKFVKISAIRNASSDITLVEYSQDMQVNGMCIVILEHTTFIIPTLILYR